MFSDLSEDKGYKEQAWLFSGWSYILHPVWISEDFPMEQISTQILPKEEDFSQR